ncbi:MAG: hypothetical protein ACP5T3_00300 [Candidatus Micrarchaeia archaeon]
MLKVRIAALAVLAMLVPYSMAQGIEIAPQSAFGNWLPVMFAAVLLSIVITSVYYVFGYLLNDKRVKERAITEFAQAIGTGILVVVIIAVLELVGSTLLSPISVLSAGSVNGICNSLVNSKVTFLNSANSASPVNAICNDIILPLASGSSKQSLTDKIDYGVAATYVVIANVTNQAANNLDAFYVYDGMISFLRELTSVNGFGSFGVWSVTFQYAPLAGYNFLRKMSLAVGIVSALVIDSFAAQLLVILLVLVTWPYVLAAGVIFRATPYTRRLGGLLIGIVLALLVIWPVLFLFEYASLGTTQSSFPIGSNTIPYTPVYELMPNGNVMVYGASSGYEQVTTQSIAGCPPGDYVYEGICGEASTVGSPPDCKLPSQISQFQMCQNGFAPDNALCHSGSYVYEGVCGDPNTSARTARCFNQNQAAQSGLPMCPSSPILHDTGIALFQLPNATETVKYYSCWPPSGNLPQAEAEAAAFYLIPFFGLGAAAYQTIASIVSSTSSVSSIPYYPPIITCSPQNALDTGLAFTNIYGITSISAFILPLLNVLIIYGAATSLSKLLGGESDILGLSKLI